MDIGFIGLGTMGRPMATHLLNSGHRLFAHSRRGVPAELSTLGAVDCSSPRDAAARSEVIIVMVPDTPDVEKVLFGASGAAEVLSRGQVIVDMSSISPVATKDFAERIEALGAFYLDAPVSGGEVGAKAASLSILVGGRPEIFARVKPLFELMGNNITLIGENGAGQTAKVANQIIVALTIQATSEALVFASRAGADPAKVRQALMGGFAASRVLEVHGERMIKRTFNPGFKLELHAKDLDLALKCGAQLNVSLPGTASCRELFKAALAQGGAHWDHSALVRVIETLADHEVGEPA